MTLRAALLGTLLSLALLAAGAARATTTTHLMDTGKLRLASEMAPATGAVPGQKMRLVLTIAVDGWFSGGTRISIPEVPGLVILQTEHISGRSLTIRITWNNRCILAWFR